MSITVNIGIFSKKVNSTAKPSFLDRSFDCILKDSCSFTSPIVVLDFANDTSPCAYNYAYIPDFKRYYFIKDWIFQDGLWSAHLEIDVLSSWKNEIGECYCYILRSSESSNGSIVDTLYPATNITTLEESQSSHSPWVTDNVENGVFVIGVAGQNTTYYLFTYEGLQLFFDYLFSDLYASDLVGEPWASIFPQLKAQCNPLQYITQIMWLPFVTWGTQVSTIRVGWVDVPVSASRVDGSGLRYGQSDWEIRRHPQSGSRGSYLNNAPYSTYSLFYPPWGLIALDPDIIANSSTISAIWGVDLRTGMGTLTVAGGELHTTSWLHAQVGVHYQVSQVVNKGYGIANTFMHSLSAGANVMSGNYVGALGNIAGSIGNMAASKIPSATTIGSSGGIDSLRGLPALQYEFKHIVNADNEHRGRPLCAMAQVSSLGGYMQVANAYISLTGTQAEREKIKEYMEGGFYFE